MSYCRRITINISHLFEEILHSNIVIALTHRYCLLNPYRISNTCPKVFLYFNLIGVLFHIHGFGLQISIALGTGQGDSGDEKPVPAKVGGRSVVKNTS